MKYQFTHSRQTRTAYAFLKLFVGLFFYAFAFYSHALVKVDCYDRNAPSNPETSNMLTVTLWDANGTLLDTHSEVPWCTHTRDAIISSQSIGDTRRTSYFIIQTNGSDAFWMDEVRFKTAHESLWGEDNKYRFGRDGGLGYCLSNDPNDGLGSWKNKVDGCHEALKFDLSSLDVFPATPVGPPTIKPALQTWNFILDMNHTHGKIDHETTKDNITVEFFSGTRKVGVAKSSDMSKEGKEKGNYRVYGVSSAITEIKISTDGDDALYIDHMHLDRQVPSHLSDNRQTKEMYNWGRINGKGWCLSTDRNDANGGWRKYLTGEDACYKSITFVVGSDTWYPSY